MITTSDLQAPDLEHLADTPITEAELTALALAADPDAEVADGAVCFWDVAGTAGDARGADAPLPEWYMPAPMGVRRFDGWRRRLVRYTVYLVIAAFIAINAYGLCNTYGQLSFG